MHIVRVSSMLSVTCISISAIAATPNYEKADKLMNEFSEMVGHDPISIGKTADYPAYGKKLNALRERAEKMFGHVVIGNDFARCTVAISMFQSAWVQQVGVMTSGRWRPFDMAMMSRNSFSSGDEYRSCRMALENLDQPATKREH